MRRRRRHPPPRFGRDLNGGQSAVGAENARRRLRWRLPPEV
ncbi:hypothetical protein E2C01_060579 [Portunus trituberculatus]|uniref:Uncharacterized protein n=1 Tax=Portunus trituberculatus TaxID=210409 RepID=A0A5B7H8H4_PORTR|nr:hypothetical protein [Portunus trituberculatus]